MSGTWRCAMLIAAMLASGPAAAAAQGSADTAPRTVAANAATLAANKRVVLGMWHDVIDGRNIAHAPRYIAANYIQHSPSAGQGRAALMAFLKTEFPDSTPLAAGSYPLTRFEFVMAEGDLVQLMFQRLISDPQDPARTSPIWWYDTYRVRNGMIVEHWDSAPH